MCPFYRVKATLCVISFSSFFQLYFLQVSPLRVRMLNNAQAGARERERQHVITTTVHEHAQSNRASNMVNFVVLGVLKRFCISLFHIL
jgi:hypothetical protein